MAEVDMSSIIEILITMVLSAFFSGMEIAFVSSNRMLAEMDKEKNMFSQRLISFFYRHPIQSLTEAEHRQQQNM